MERSLNKSIGGYIRAYGGEERPWGPHDNDHSIFRSETCAYQAYIAAHRLTGEMLEHDFPVRVATSGYSRLALAIRKIYPTNVLYR